TYTLLTTLNGCSSGAITIVQVKDKEFTAEYNLFPNPNNGNMTIQGPTQSGAPAQITITDAIGRSFVRTTILPENKQLDAAIPLAGRLSSGVYFMQLKVEGRTYIFKFSVVR